MSNEYILNNGHLIFKYGFKNILSLINDNFIKYKDEYVEIKNIYSVLDGIVRCEFLVTNEKMISEINDIESKLSSKVQKDIFELYMQKFEVSLLDFLTNQLEKLKVELEKDNNIEYQIFPSHATMFTYLNKSKILRLEILL